MDATAGQSYYTGPYRKMNKSFFLETTYVIEHKRTLDMVPSKVWHTLNGHYIYNFYDEHFTKHFKLL